QHDGEGRALAGCAADVDAPAVALRHVLDDGQPEAGAAGLARAAAIDAVEALGQARQVLGRDARAAVGDVELGPALLADAPARRDPAAAGRIAHRVAHEVGHGADELGLGARDPEVRSGGVGFYVM